MIKSSQYFSEVVFCPIVFLMAENVYKVKWGGGSLPNGIPEENCKSALAGFSHKAASIANRGQSSSPLIC